MENSTFVFAVDMDGVMGNYHAAFSDFVAQSRGIPRDLLGEATHWDYSQSWPELFPDIQDFLSAHADAVSDGRLFEVMEPYPNVSEQLWRLSDAGVSIRVVTSRLLRNRMHADVCSQTVAWLDEHNIPYREIVFARSDKRDIRSSVAIDDSPHNIEAWRSVGVPTIIMDHPYNRHLTGLRAGTWDEVGDIVLAAYHHQQHWPLAAALGR